ncbi:MAG: hypothetical protein N4A46_13095 [Schleiferiaceae bacterium]|jgi:hypothetical protein|nr:hypothetical protein [Schleiferiaceae bacterium]
MLRFGLFKQQKPKQFNLQPRYYNERKERLAKLKAKYEAPAGEEDFDAKLYRDHLRSSWSQKRLTSSKGVNPIRVLVIFAVLAGLIYWVFN